MNHSLQQKKLQYKATDSCVCLYLVTYCSGDGLIGLHVIIALHGNKKWWIIRTKRKLIVEKENNCGNINTIIVGKKILFC